MKTEREPIFIILTERDGNDVILDGSRLRCADVHEGKTRLLFDDMNYVFVSQSVKDIFRMLKEGQ